jgi:hydroxymethylglutaryl-CoA lyase
MIPSHVTLVEVGPRDGLQNEKQPVDAAVKVELVHRLQAAGLREIEVTSFVSPKWVPQMADNVEVMAGMQRRSNVRYSVLTPNLKGLEAALASKPDEIVVCCAVSVALGCPYQGEVTPDEVERVVLLMKGIGVDHCGIADTIGVGTPRRVQAALERALKHFPLAEVSGHFHDTYGQAIGNVYAGLEVGIATFDASVAGLGGCPYAKGATGNVATEDVLFLLDGLGIETGISLDGVVDAAAFISGVLGRKPVSRVGNALLAKRAAATAPRANEPSR